MRFGIDLTGHVLFRNVWQEVIGIHDSFKVCLDCIHDIFSVFWTKEHYLSIVTEN